jgi:hypothetical protein
MDIAYVILVIAVKIVVFQIHAKIIVTIMVNVFRAYANVILVGKEMTAHNKFVQMTVVIMEDAKTGDVNVMKAMKVQIVVLKSVRTNV